MAQIADPADVGAAILRQGHIAGADGLHCQIRQEEGSIFSPGGQLEPIDRAEFSRHSEIKSFDLFVPQMDNKGQGGSLDHWRLAVEFQVSTQAGSDLQLHKLNETFFIFQKVYL